MMTSTARSGETRERILAVAAGEFASKGYASASIGAIAERAGMGKGLVQYHFKAKVDLATTIVEAAFAAASFESFGLRDDSLRGLSRLVLALRSIATLYRDDVTVRAAVRLVREYEIVPAVLPTPYVGWIAVSAERLREAAQDGEIAPLADANEEAWHIIAGFVGVQELSNRFSQLGDLPERVDEMLERQFRSLGVADSAKYFVP